MLRSYIYVSTLQSEWAAIVKVVGGELKWLGLRARPF